MIRVVSKRKGGIDDEYIVVLKAKLTELVNVKGKEAARTILSEFGAAKLVDLEAENYADAHAKAVAAMAEEEVEPEKWNGKGTDFTVRQYAKDLDAFIEQLGGPVYLVGWSYGAHIALKPRGRAQTSSRNWYWWRRPSTRSRRQRTPEQMPSAFREPKRRRNSSMQAIWTAASSSPSTPSTGRASGRKHRRPFARCCETTPGRWWASVARKRTG